MTQEAITLIQLLNMFPNEETARKWFEDIRWGKGQFCPYCGSVKISCVPREKPMPY